MRSVCALYRPGEWLWVDSNDTYGKPKFRRRASRPWVSAICNHFADIAAWSQKSLKIITQKLTFWKKDPYGQIFKNLFRKDSRWHRSTYCVRISWNLADRKLVKSCVIFRTKNIGSLFRSCFCPDRAQNLSQPALDNILKVPHISTKSVHFRQSYSRTSEHRWNAP